MNDDAQLLQEIRDLLKEQNRLIAELKTQNELAMARSAEHMAKAEAHAENSIIQNAKALGQTGWLKWSLWVFLVALLLVFLLPNVAR